MRRLFALILVGGCGFSLTGQSVPLDGSDAPVLDGRADADGATDALVDGPSTCMWTFAPSNLDPCDAVFPSPTDALVLTVGVWTYDTSSGQLRSPLAVISTPASALVAQSGGAMVRVVSVVSLEIQLGASLRVRGTAPLLIAANTTATITGEIDASGAGADAGPGAYLNCAAPTAGGAGTGTGGAGGGGGAGHGAFGGGGAAGDSTGFGGGGAAGGTSGAAISPLRGGCTGGAGGAQIAAGGAGGGGGGAIQVSARMALTLDGRVVSAGGGGQTGDSRSGGGGGGAGGTISLEAPTITIGGLAALCANGGSGGEGGGTGSTNASGTNGTCSGLIGASTISLGLAGDGGPGGYLASSAGGSGTTGSGGRGGGGGGGAVGQIRLRAMMAPTIPITTTVSPAAL